MTSKAREKIKRERSRIKDYWALKAAQLALMSPEFYTKILEAPAPSRKQATPWTVLHAASEVLGLKALKAAGHRRLHIAIWQMAHPDWTL